MKSFTDNTGRTWSLVVNVATVKRVRALADFDINGIVEISPDGHADTSSLERLQSDPVLLVDVLYAVCKPEADEKKISDEDFGRAMWGDAIEHASEALLEEIVDFFPGAKRLVFRSTLQAIQQIQQTATKQLQTILNQPDFQEKLVSEVARLTGSSTAVQESADSIQTSSLSPS